LEHEYGEAVTIACPFSRGLLRGMKIGDVIAIPLEPSIFISQSGDTAQQIAEAIE
jgi:hypothetical protein